MKIIILPVAFLLIHLWLGAQDLSGTAPRMLANASHNSLINNDKSKTPQSISQPTDNLDSRHLIKKAQTQKAYLQYQKLSVQEYERFKQNLLAEGYLAGRRTGKVPAELFLKKDMTITIAPNDLDTRQGYLVTIEKKALPRIKQLRFAEDLLAFNAHQHLVLVFGAQNVQKDLFYHADGTAANCSVIYPATSREVVFLWQDTANFFQLDCIRIGGNTHTAGAMRHNNALAQNQWISKQGLYATMTLNQLQSRNGNALKFYGWGGGARGNLCGNNRGNIDFKTLDLSFGCLNCNDDAYYGKRQLASDRAIEDGRRIFIATLILYPPTAGR